MIRNAASKMPLCRFTRESRQISWLMGLCACVQHCAILAKVPKSVQVGIFSGPALANRALSGLFG